MSKNQGDIGELAFTLKAKNLGFNVAKPYSAITPYDLILDNGVELLKIQVKTTTSKTKHNGYKVATGRGRHSKEAYSITDVDYFALYIIGLDIFYIVPAHQITTTTLNLYPGNKSHRLDTYRNAWHLLK